MTDEPTASEVKGVILGEIDKLQRVYFVGFYPDRYPPYWARYKFGSASIRDHFATLGLGLLLVLEGLRGVLFYNKYIRWVYLALMLVLIIRIGLGAA